MDAIIAAIKITSQLNRKAKMTKELIAILLQKFFWKRLEMEGQNNCLKTSLYVFIVQHALIADLFGLLLLLLQAESWRLAPAVHS